MVSRAMSRAVNESTVRLVPASWSLASDEMSVDNKPLPLRMAYSVFRLKGETEFGNCRSRMSHQERGVVVCCRIAARWPLECGSCRLTRGLFTPESMCGVRI